MNTPGLVATSPLQVALQMPSEPGALPNQGDFTAALAAACVAEPEAGMPEGMQSAAALAWLAGLMGSTRPAATPESGGLVTADSADAADLEVGTDVVSEAALSILQGMLVPAVSGFSRQPVVEPGTPAAVSTADVMVAAAFAGPPGEIISPSANSASTATALAAEGVAPESDTAPLIAVATGTAAVAATHRAAPAGVPLALLRAMNLDAQPEVPASAQVDSMATSGIAIENTATGEALPESSMGERMIGALADRASMRTDGTVVPAAVDRNDVTGPNLYTSTRETIANASGQVSRPEVVHSTVGSPRWANELGSRLAMMSVRGQQEGSLTLTPEHLGPLEVRISMNQDTTNVWFGAQHADTRAALVDALPRLREMFAASGLALGQAGVSHEMPGREAGRGETSDRRIAGGSEPGESLPVVTARISTGLLDTWA